MFFYLFPRQTKSICFMWDLLLVFEVRAWHSLRIMCEFTAFLPNPQLSWPAFRQAGRRLSG